MPVDPTHTDPFNKRLRNLLKEKLFGHYDPVFPLLEIGHVRGEFTVLGFGWDINGIANAILKAIKDAFEKTCLPSLTPHAFRKTPVK